MIGSRAEVFHGNADNTSGGLAKKDLMMKDGRIVSKAASKAAKKSLKKNPKFQAFVELAKKRLIVTRAHSVSYPPKTPRLIKKS